MKKEFFRFMNALDDKTYLEYYITYLICPMFTGVKPASLIGLDNGERKLLAHWCTLGGNYLKEHDLKAFPLRKYENKHLILFYNEENLLGVLKEENNKQFLERLGYSDFENLDTLLNHLCERYNSYNCPHEIGIFLGIPLSDVEAFINCDGRHCLLCGYWKVFSDEQKAKELFNTYDWSKEMMMTHSVNGKSLPWIINFLNFKEPIAV